MLPYVELHPGMERQYHQFARRVVREGDAPEPLSTLTMCGMPPSVRFMPPEVRKLDNGTVSSFQSIT